MRNKGIVVAFCVAWLFVISGCGETTSETMRLRKKNEYLRLKNQSLTDQITARKNKSDSIEQQINILEEKNEQLSKKAREHRALLVANYSFKPTDSNGVYSLEFKYDGPTPFPRDGEPRLTLRQQKQSLSLKHL